MRSFLVGIVVATIGALAALPVATRAGEIVVNGSFEAGEFGSSWVHGAFRKKNQNPDLADHIVVPDLPYAGNYSALIGFKYSGQGNATAYMYQDVVVPANISSAVLDFEIRMQGYDGDFQAQFIADIRATDDTVLENVLTTSFTDFDNKFKDSGWMSDDGVSPDGHDVSAYAGQTIRLYFSQSNLNDNNLETWSYVDGVSLVFRKWVDLFVDGNGDDVFGALASGQGGLSARSGVAGDTLYYTLTVENEGPVADSYELSVTPPAGWTVLIDAGAGPQPFPQTTPVLATGETIDYTVAVVTPAGAAGGSYDVIIDALSSSQGNRFDSATLRANVVDAIYGADLIVEGNGYGTIGPDGAGGFALKTSTWDTPQTYAVELRNSGNQTTTYAVDFDAVTPAAASVWYEGTQYFGPFSTLPVADGETVAMTLEVTVPAAQPGGDYETILYAAATGDTLRRDSITAVTRLLEPLVDMVIVTNGDGIYDDTQSGWGGSSTIASELGLVVNFPVLVQNESAVPDSFTLDWVPPGGGWSAVIEIDGVDYAFPVTTPTFAPFTQASYVLKVDIRNGASYGTYRSILNAFSETDPRVSESVAASISVSNASDIDMVIDGNGLGIYGPLSTGLGGLSSHTAEPGDTVWFDLTLIHVAGIDSSELSWNTPPGWEVTLDGDPSPQSGVPAGTYALRVVVPVTAARGNFDVIVDGHKSDKPFLMDSVTGRVIVVPGARVDGVIDGDGDGVYGALGAGDGGISQVGAPAPATVNFTVEIQNEGALDDQYAVSWGAIPGWIATFAGSTSPFVTAPIPAGGSGLFTFSVSVPAGALSGQYDYTIDIASTSDPSSFESLSADVIVFGPPRADLVIDGDGADVYGPMGTGLGGQSVRGAVGGASYTATLRLRNTGAFADSFRVQWDVPNGWPAGSVVINDGSVDQVAPFWSQVLAADQFVDYTVKVQVPPGANDAHTAIINAWSSLPPNLTESVALVTETRALVRGVVFDDRDHDQAFGPGDVPLAGVSVVEQGSGAAAVTDASGAYTIYLAAPAAVTVVERNPSGYVSLSPDTLGPFAALSGDTITADFADVAPLQLSAGTVRTGLAGGYIDFPHRLSAGTPGHVDLTAVNDGGAVTMFLLDENDNGVFDGADRTLQSADTDLDPAVNGGAVSVLLRLFIPAGVPDATTIHVDVTATQTLAAVTLIANAHDAAVVVGSALGQVALVKAADLAGAVPGDLITYTIDFVNTGADSIRNLVVLDPISPWVDLEADAFGPGLDLEWSNGAAPPVFLTFSPADADECEYSAAERLLRLIFSKNGPFYVGPGEAGRLTYRVRVR